jgi:hypothetical protein
MPAVKRGANGSPQMTSVALGGPDTMALFAIGPAQRDIGGYGGSSPRETKCFTGWCCGTST